MIVVKPCHPTYLVGKPSNCIVLIHYLTLALLFTFYPGLVWVVKCGKELVPDWIV